MRKLTKYNVNIFFFIASASLFMVAFIIYLTLLAPDTTRAFRGLGDEKAKIVFMGTLSAAVSMFVLGWLTRATRPPRADDSQALAHDKANDLLDKIAHSNVGHVLTSESSRVVRIPKLIDDRKTPELQMYKPILEELYELTPACLLPLHYGETHKSFLDWHKYDLCIIAAKEDQDLAQRIRDGLLRQNSEWRIYFDEVDQAAIGENQEAFIKKVFFAGSSRCLALLSFHTVSNPRRKFELNYAMQRELREDEACRDYLKPIPLDDHGLRFMKKDPYLRRYAKNLEIIRNQRKLCDAIVSKLSESLFYHTFENISAESRPPIRRGDRRFAVALSFPGERRSFVKEVADELDKRLRGEKVFYDGNHEAELARPDMDTYLQKIYRDQSELVVVFLCAGYDSKMWCKLEWRVVRQTLGGKRPETIMPVRFDDTHIEGLFTIDGYINANDRKPEEIAELIMQRLILNREPQ